MDIINNFIFWWNISSFKKMRNKKIFYISLSIMVFIFFILFVSLNKNNIYSNDHVKNQKITNFESTELFTNKKFNFNSLIFKNKYTILNIWASWCAPCRAEHIFLLELSKSNDVDLIGLNYKDKTENAKSFVSELGNPYDLILVDPKGLISIEFGAVGVPETFIIDNKSKIIKKYIGPLDKNKMKEIISILSL